MADLPDTQPTSRRCEFPLNEGAGIAAPDQRLHIFAQAGERGLIPRWVIGATHKHDIHAVDRRAFSLRGKGNGSACLLRIPATGQGQQGQCRTGSDGRRAETAHAGAQWPKRRTTPPPPWTLMVCPLTQPAAGEQSQRKALATSCGEPGRPVRLSGLRSFSCIAGSMPASA